MPSKLWDVVVIGGGPGGATAGGLLAKAGHDVLILEKEHFPRFHIGESLLPAELPIFERLGFDVTRAGFGALRKGGAEFHNERTGKHGRFLFDEAMPGTRTHAFQVERAPFDEAMLANAERLGAQVRQGVKVSSVGFTEEMAKIESTEGEIQARFVVDATGRDRLLCKQNKSFERIDGLGLAAVWAHFEDLSDEAIADLEETGNIRVLVLPEKTWVWLIPLVGGRLSVGLVSATKGVVSAEYFEQVWAESPMLQKLTGDAKRGELQIAGDYSYRNTKSRGGRFGCIGDASYFLDPIFSSGVAFAMAGGEKLADLLSPALRSGSEGDAELLAPLEEYMRRPFEVFGSVVWSFYHTGMVENLFFYEGGDETVSRGITTLLAGDVWREDNVFQQMMLRSGRRKGGRRRRS